MAISRNSQSTIANFNKYNKTSAGFDEAPELGLWLTTAGGTTTFSSPDAFTWTSRSLPISTSSVNHSEILFAERGKIKFLNRRATLALSQRGYFETSDGINYTQAISQTASSGALNTTYFLRLPNGEFSQLWSRGSSTNENLFYDGQSWNLFPMTADAYTLLAKDNFIFAGFLSSSSGRVIQRSSNGGRTWSDAGPADTNIRSMATNGSRIVACSNNTIYSSDDDGATWTNRGAMNFDASVRFLGGQFIIVANTGQIRTSPTGEVWTTQSTGTSAHLRDVAFGQGIYAVCGNGVVLTSPNGSSWTLRSGVSGDLRGIAYA